MVLAAYVEPLVRGRRVAVFGDATAGLAERVAERGARLVHAWDPNPARAAEALARSPGGRVSHGVLDQDLGVRDGAFDLVLVPDLSLFENAGDLVRRARRMLGPSGVFVLSSPNPEVERRLVPAAESDAEAAAPLGYYDLYDVVSLQFSTVRMAGQAPFVGYTVADFAPDGEPEVSVDTSLLEASEEPEWFVAIASERPVDLDQFAVIEIPFEDIEQPPATPRQLVAGGGAVDRAALDEARARVASLTDELQQLRDRHGEELRVLEVRGHSAATLSSRVVELEGELDARTARVRDLESRAGDAHVRAERLAHELRELEEELARQRDRATRLTKQLDDEKKARTKADVDLGMIRAKPELAGAKDRLEAVTAELDAARARITELERDREHTNTARSASMVSPTHELRIAELEREADQNRETLSLLTAQRDDAAARVHELELALDETDRARLELTARIADHARELEDRERQAVDAEQADIANLEVALQARGHKVAELERQLREAERLGRELVEELEAAREVAVVDDAAWFEPAQPAGAAPATIFEAATAEPSGLRDRLDSLAGRAAECEANLQASAWRIAELERRLAQALDVEPPATIHRELEQALVAAREEVAVLRRRLGEGARGGDVEEQAVLLHQVASELAKSADPG
jgi:SAM-dependent methyltransferase